MKKRYKVLILCCIICVAATSLHYHREYVFPDICPAIEAGTYQATINWFGLGDEENYSCNANISNDEFHNIFTSVRMKKGSAYIVEPVPAFYIRLVYGETGYSITIGDDNSISLAPLDDLEKRTFWSDCDEKIFSTLYACHLNNGGVEIPVNKG